MAEHTREIIIIGVVLGVCGLLLLLILGCRRRRPDKPELHPNNQSELPVPTYNQAELPTSIYTENTSCVHPIREEYAKQAAYNPNYIEIRY
ncbi:hypothetical protein CBL_04470 [Carabus blaptoides fortunei]